MMLYIAVYALPIASVIAAVWTLAATVAYVRELLRAGQESLQK